MENIRRILRTLFLGCIVFIGSGKDVCENHIKKPKSGIIGQNATLSCALSSCGAGHWTFRGTSSIQHSEQCSQDGGSYYVNDIVHNGHNGNNVNTNLHIINLTMDHAGIYDCICDNQTQSSRVVCFNLTVHQIPN